MKSNSLIEWRNAKVDIETSGVLLDVFLYFVKHMLQVVNEIPFQKYAIVPEICILQAKRAYMYVSSTVLAVVASVISIPGTMATVRSPIAIRTISGLFTA